jgi:hypothetical protein
VKRNTDLAFVGLPVLKDQQREQLERFEQAAGHADWMAIHRALRLVDVSDRLLATSWGWDLSRSGWVPAPRLDQCWQRWPIRLYKATKSVKLFGCKAEFESLKRLGRDLMDRGETMHYLRDLSWLFRDCS